MSDRTPYMVLDDMARCMAEMDRDRAEYRDALTRQASAKLAYEREMARQIVGIVNDHRSRGDRLPAEDVRKALALDSVDAQYAALLSSEADVEGLKRSIAVRQSVLSGLQSELAQMRLEVGG